METLFVHGGDNVISKPDAATEEKEAPLFDWRVGGFVRDFDTSRMETAGRHATHRLHRGNIAYGAHRSIAEIKASLR